jgi:dihydroxy-acid dehydratase
VAPEAAEGQNFSLIQNGDMIELDVAARKLNIDISPGELETRRKKRKPYSPAVDRGYVNLYMLHVEQANLGADLDFLRGGSGSEVTRDSH